jgi:sterol desaturase/sphingolipid hydroxylase (fatty acid hydroxylase superfamily)
MSSDGRSDALRSSPRMFRSNALDRLSRVHPSVPVIIFGPLIVAMGAWALEGVSFPSLVGLVIAGYALWTLLEYWLHRIVFHFEPEQGFGARVHWIIHGVHHDHPNDPMRLVMPPAVSVPLGGFFFLIFFLVLGSAFGPGVSAGFFAGYLVYDMTHFYVHHGHPRSRVAKVLRERHMRHHFQDDTRGFGVSAPYWDNVFGTAPRSRRETSEPASRG